MLGLGRLLGVGPGRERRLPPVDHRDGLPPLGDGAGAAGHAAGLEPVAGLATFSLTILGTFLTRSGVLESVHSFNNTGIGPALLGFFGLVVAVGVA